MTVSDLLWEGGSMIWIYVGRTYKQRVDVSRLNEDRMTRKYSFKFNGHF